MKHFFKNSSDGVRFAIIIVLVFTIWGGAWWAVNSFIALRQPVSVVPTVESAREIANAAYRGQFGDQFGAVNALFSGLAFAGIIFTILLQRSDLAETRKSMAHDRFDSAFFELLKLQMSITEGVNLLGKTGKQAFVGFHTLLKEKDPEFYVYAALSKIDRLAVRTIIDSRSVTRAEYSNLDEADINNIMGSLGKGVRALENFLDENKVMHEGKVTAAYGAAAELAIDDFAHYFRNLYNLLKFVDDSEQIELGEKFRYSKIVRSQLSEAELIVLFYNSIGKIRLAGREDLELGYPKMAALLVKYDILQNMNPRSIIHPIHKVIFDKNSPKGAA